MKLSIIVPVYNVEKYLPACLESVVNQTLDEYEVILVNDGSTDRSYEICRKYAEKYKCIKLLNQSNKGISATRNRGIQVATGEYIGFVDSDDVTYLNMYEVMYTHAKKNDCDIVVCNFENIDEEGMFLGRVNYEVVQVKEDRVLEDAEIIESYMNREIMIAPWDKIYRRQLFEGIEQIYDEGRCFEDHLGSLRLISQAKKMVIIKETLYAYRIREGSITNTDTFKHMTDEIEQMQKSLNYIKEHFGKQYISGQYNYIKWIKELIIHNLSKYPKLLSEKQNLVSVLKDKRPILFGGSKLATETINEWNKCGLSPSYICDNDEKKWGTMIEGIPIIAPDKLKRMKQENIKIFITSIYVGSILKQLIDLKIVTGIEDIYQFNDEVSIEVLKQVESTIIG